MCDFGVTAIVSMVIAGVSAATSTYASLRQAAYATKIANNQAKAQDIAAGQARDTGQQEAFNVSQEASQQQSEVIAEASSSGIDVQASSTGDLADRFSGSSWLGQQSKQVGAMRQAWGYEYAADQSRAQAQQAQVTGYLGAAESILGGAGSIVGSAGEYSYRKKMLADKKNKIV